MLPVMSPSRSAALDVLLAGCQPQPELLCDRARVVWPYLEIDPTIDTSPEEGIQIDLDLRSSLPEGTIGRLFVIGEDGEAEAHPDESVVDEEGRLSYREVTLPL